MMPIRNRAERSQGVGGHYALNVSMKPIKRWSVSILVASAMLLSAANGAPIESPNQPNQRTNGERKPDHQTAATTPSRSSINQPARTPSANQGATYVYNQYKESSPWGDVPTWLEAIATLGLLAFAAWQMGLIKAAAIAARDNAVAAKKSADVAAKSDRPVLVVEGYVPNNIGGLGQTNERITSVNFRIANCGKGPALDVEASGNIKVANAPIIPPYFGDCKTVPLRQRVVEASKNIPAFVAYMPHKGAVLLSNEEVADANEGRRRLFVYGQITYRDIHRNQYRTLFGVEYLPPRFSGPERFFPSPDEYNRHIDDGPEDS